MHILKNKSSQAQVTESERETWVAEVEVTGIGWQVSKVTRGDKYIHDKQVFMKASL